MENINISVKDIMSTNLKTLNPKDKLKQAKKLFDTYDIHHIPIQVMGDVRGIISLGDILFLEGVTINSFDKFLKNKKFEIMTIDEIMTHKPYCMDVDDLVSEVIELMTEKRINALPIRENDELVGIVTTHDIMKYLSGLLN